MIRYWGSRKVRSREKGVVRKNGTQIKDDKSRFTRIDF
jgi:lysozyme family protein